MSLPCFCFGTELQSKLQQSPRLLSILPTVEYKNCSGAYKVCWEASVLNSFNLCFFGLSTFLMILIHDWDWQPKTNTTCLSDTVLTPSLFLMIWDQFGLGGINLGCSSEMWVGFLVFFLSCSIKYYYCKI